MGDVKGFLKVKRRAGIYRPVCERVKDFGEVCVLPAESQAKEQASRCMDCGTPFCHWSCPIGNYIPEWNDAFFRDQKAKAFMLLFATNNLPEITGRICPAPCEYSCVLGINDDPVTVRENELSIIETAFSRGDIRARPPASRTGRKVAVIGSGPAGLSCADQLNKAGHQVSVFERDDEIGGILRYGIPDFKLDKQVIERRIKILREEGIVFNAGIDAGIDYPADKLISDFDAVCLCAGSRVPRDLKIEGRQLKGIYFAMDYLIQSNRRVSGRVIAEERVDVKGKKVVVIGGGDTGADCVGTAHRQKAACVMQIEIMPQPPSCRTKEQSWPKYPTLLKTSSSHEEGGRREWAVMTKRFIGDGAGLKRLLCSRVEFQKDSMGCPAVKEIQGSDFEIEADIAVLALGFLHPEKGGLVEGLGLELDSRGNIKTDNEFMSSQKGVFAAGDCRRGQSLVVWAISEGRRAAYNIDKFLMGQSRLPCI